MKIKNINVKNKFINYENIEIDFSKKGIYLIQGENGSGKTSLLEEIIFGKYEVEFSNKDHYKYFEGNRYQLFSYVAQNIYATKLSVYDYICKGNSNLETGKITQLMKNFGIEDLNLSLSFNKLSGGEKVKLSIISALLKEAPYIFMDEPTNNLDDSSIETMNRIIEEQALNKTFIIVSHDKRFRSDNINSLYTLFGQRIEEKIVKDSGSINNSVVANIKKPSYSSIMRTITSNLASYISAITFATLIAAMFFVTNVELDYRMNVEEIPVENIILVFGNELGFGELNRVYFEGAGLEIIPERSHNSISHMNIPQIAEIEGVESIFLFDLPYLRELDDKVRDGTAIDSLNFVMVPQIMLETNMQVKLRGFGFSFQDVYGEMPKDEANEVTLSRDLLIRHFGFSVNDVDEAIGQSIEIKGQQYKIVGFNAHDFLVISFIRGVNDYGIHLYDGLHYEEFVYNTTQFFDQQQAYFLRDFVNAAVIITENGMEKDVLNTLMQVFQGNHYDSYIYATVWIREHNSDVITKITAINMVISGFMAAILLVLNKNAIKSNFKVIRDFENYYINRKSIRFIYNIHALATYLGVVIALLILNSILSPFYFITGGILILSSIVILSPILILHFIGTKYNGR